jgi:NADPH2:quinone reductase
MINTKAIVLRHFGGYDELKPEVVLVNGPGPGELLLRQTAVGVNFHDCYVRSGLYKTLELPGIPGVEACGVVEALGEGVEGFVPGDRVAYVTSKYGAYAQHRCLSAELAVKVPNSVTDAVAAALMVKGLTTAVLLHDVCSIRSGDIILVHAAAGGVGSLLCQWASHIGAEVIGTVGSEAKLEVAKANGCKHAINYTSSDFVKEVKRITSGVGVTVVYDSVGKDTFNRSLQCLAPMGHLVNFGQSSGPVDPFAPSLLAHGSLSVTRPILFHYISNPARLLHNANLLFDALSRSIIRIQSITEYSLDDAGHAHEDLESRRMIGLPVLRP